MTTYVLILLYWTLHQASGAMVAAEFTSQQACESAGEASKVKFEGWSGHVDYICVMK